MRRLTVRGLESRLAADRLLELSSEVVFWLLADDHPEVAADAKRMKQILKMDRDELCRKQNRC